jgi:hypothetical protein
MTIYEQQHEASESEEHETIKDYRPFAIQTTSLMALMVLTSCLITLLIVLRHFAPIRTQDHITMTLADSFPYTIITAPAVIYACIWLAVDCNVMRMEPIYQFAESQECQTGSTDSLTFSYIACNVLTVPVRALKRKQWAVFYSSLSHVIASTVLPTVVTEMLQIEFGLDYGTMYISYRPVFLWIAIASLAAILLFTGCLITTLWDRKSRTKADPSSIVGLAITFAGTDILTRRRSLDPQTPPESAGLRWLYRRHIRGSTHIVFHIDGSETIAQQPLLAQAACSSHTGRKSHLAEVVIEEDHKPSRFLHMIKSLYGSAGLIVLPLLLLPTVVGLSSVYASQGYHDWINFNYDIFRPVLVLISTLIKSLWTTIERGELKHSCKRSTNNHSCQNL